MDLLSEYDADSAERQETAPIKLLKSSHSSVNIAQHAGPHVALALRPDSGAVASHTSALSSAIQSGLMTSNLPVSVMYAPIVGPISSSSGKTAIAPPSVDSFRTVTATLTHDSMDPSTFSTQYNMYTQHRYAADPSGSGALVGDASRYALAHGQSSAPQSSAQKHAAAQPGVKRAREVNEDSADAQGYLGPWAGYEGEKAYKVSALEAGTLTMKQKLLRLDQGLNPDGPGKLEGEALDKARARIKAEQEKAKKEEEKAALASGAGAASSTPVVGSKGAGQGVSSSSGSRDDSGDSPASGILTPAQCKSTFHGSELLDYQGRSWMEAPKGVRADEGEHECFVPKKLIHRWSGHGKGVNSVQFFPGTGHLLLSGALDGKAKVWDVAGSKGLRRTLSGHTGGVRTAVWSLDGRKIATGSFDRSCKVWDTETGSCLASYSNGATPLCIAWAPEQEGSVLLTGTQNKKILQYDLRVKSGGAAGSSKGSRSDSSLLQPSPEPTLDYTYHMGPVNAITFFDNGRRFFSAGDDRMLVWDYNTPVPIKHIADPAQHAVTAAALHPDGVHWVGQCMDNTMMVFQLGDKVGRNMKKTFRGHIVSGYACQPAFSPDGRFVGSGDGDGHAWIWDWRSGRVLNKVKAHDNGPCVGMSWHPLQPSWVATCGWDGVIKLWD